jgi:hypothetical protein
VIVAVCADKGAPGATTLATVLGLVWPGERLVVEADPSGADCPLRMWLSEGVPLQSQPTVLSLAADVRVGVPDGALPGYAQETAVGVPVICGALSAEAYLPMRALWPQVAAELARWPGTVIADLGRVQPGHAAVPVARAATATVILARPTVDGLYHLRDRVIELARLLGDPQVDRSPVAVVLRARPRQRTEAVAAATRMLHATGVPVPVAGAVSDDPDGAEALAAGHRGRRLLRSSLVASATVVAHQLIQWWPALAQEPRTGSPERRLVTDTGTADPWLRAAADIARSRGHR